MKIRGKCQAIEMSGSYEHHCTNPAKMRYEGESFCHVHDPVKKKAWNSKMKRIEVIAEGIYQQEKAGAERVFLCVQACDSIPTEALKNEIVKEMIETFKTIIDLDGDKAILVAKRMSNGILSTLED